MSNRALCLASLAVSLAALVVSDDAAAFCRMTTDSEAQIGDADCVERGEPLEWNNTCLSYAIDSRGSYWMDYGDVEEAIDRAFKTWEDADCGNGKPNLFFQALEPSTCKRAEYNCTGNVNTIAFLGSPDEPGEGWEDPCRTPDQLPYANNAFAVTIVWHDTVTGEILDADMMINDQRSNPLSAGGPYAICPDTGCTGNDADLRSIVTHEAGHFIGIGHCNPIDEEDPNDPCVQATMFAMADRESVNKRTLAADDIAAVCTIYPPGDLDPSTCNAAPNGGLQLNCETDADGNPIACSDSTCTTSNGGCSATNNPADAPWGPLLAALVGLSVWRRRNAARS